VFSFGFATFAVETTSAQNEDIPDPPTQAVPTAAIPSQATPYMESPECSSVDQIQTVDQHLPNEYNSPIEYPLELLQGPPLCEENVDFGSFTFPKRSQPQSIFPPRNARTLGITEIVPHHQRTAEIWIKFPENTNPYLSVNFNEYPPDGDFRIIKTTIPTREPRRYYLSAWTCDVDQISQTLQKAHLTPTQNHLILPENSLGQRYIDLTPGMHAEVCFECQPITNVEAHSNSSLPQADAPTVPSELSITELGLTNDLLQSICDEISTGTAKLNKLSGSTDRIADSVIKLNRTLIRNANGKGNPTVPAVAVPKSLSNRFNVEVDDVRLSATVAQNDGKIVAVTDLPGIEHLDIECTHIPDGTPEQPFKATVTFQLVEFHPEKNIGPLDTKVFVWVKRDGDRLHCSIPFDQQVGQALEKKLTGLPLTHRKYILQPYFEDTNLKNLNFNGKLGNGIILQIP